MTVSPAPRFLLMNRFRMIFAAVGLFICLVSIWVLAVGVREQLDNQKSIRQVNVQWGLSQIEFELIRLERASERAQGQAATLDEVRLRFNLFYSRVSILNEGGLFSNFRKMPEFAEVVAPLNQFVATYLPVIDGPDVTLRASLPQMLAQTQALEKPMRALLVNGLIYHAAINDQTRAEVQHTLTLTAALTLIFITALLALISLLLRLDRINRVNARHNQQTLSLLSATVKTAQEAIITMNDRGEIVDLNEAATQTFGFARSEAIGQNLARLITCPAGDDTIFLPGPAPVLADQGQARIMMRHKAGHEVPVELSMSQSLSGDTPLYVYYLRDLTQQLATESALVIARDEALASEKAKSDLLVVMSHEIRTPLNGMIGTIELLGDTDLATQQKEYLRILAVSGGLLMHHVNDVLDIARLDGTHAADASADVDLAALVQEVLENQAPAARKNTNVMRFEGPQDGRIHVVVVGALLRQVLLNLVGNAIKFTHRGEIVVRVTHASPTGPTVISVSDTGIGIAPADLPRIFEDFVTLDASYARTVSGTGLGLGIVRRIVGRLGGTMAVASTPGHGSKFRLTLPLPILDRVAPAAITAVRAPGPLLVTLVVEDNEFNRVIMRDMLRHEGHEVVEARDGLEGIILAGGRRFDLIFMDISMPRIDGLRATQAIRQGVGASRDSRIIAMTAHAQTADRQRLQAAGLNDALIKPITRLALQTVLAGAQSPDPQNTDRQNTDPQDTDDLQSPDPQSQAPKAILVDLAVVQCMTGDLGRDQAQRLLDRFLTETGQSVASLVLLGCNAGLDDTSLKEVHRLEGSAAMFGAPALREALSQIQTLRATGTAADIRARMPGLQNLWQQTQQAYCDAGVTAQLSSLR